MPNQFRQINNRVMHDIIDLITGNGVTFYEQIYLNATRRETSLATVQNQTVITYSTYVQYKSKITLKSVGPFESLVW
jgi:hypothetical protein